jgi:hypothetical protein
MNKRNAQKLEETKMGFLRALLGFKIQSCQRNCNIQNRLKIENTVQYFKTYQRNWLDHLKRMDTVRLPRLVLHFLRKEGR